MQHYHLSLRAWAAFSPFRVAPEEWEAWSSGDGLVAQQSEVNRPDMSFVPPRMKRRLGALGKAALRCAKTVEPEEEEVADSVIFCSQHGEVSKTVALLQEFAREGVLSPVGFSHSVHNAIAGIYSIVRHSHRPTTAISAGPDSVFTTVVEAYTQLRELLASGATDPRVLCVVYDDSIPSELLRRPVSGGEVQAMAMMLGLPADGALNHFSIGLLPPHDDAVSDASTDYFLRFVLGGTPRQVLLNGEGCQWSLRRTE